MAVMVVGGVAEQPENGVVDPGDVPHTDTGGDVFRLDMEGGRGGLA